MGENKRDRKKTEWDSRKHSSFVVQIKFIAYLLIRSQELPRFLPRFPAEFKFSSVNFCLHELNNGAKWEFSMELIMNWIALVRTRVFGKLFDSSLNYIINKFDQCFPIELNDIKIYLKPLPLAPPPLLSWRFNFTHSLSLCVFFFLRTND